MSRHTRISVVTPNYNHARFLESTLRSILDQGYPNVECIVVDGGSTDGSVTILNRYASRLSWWVSERDSGQADAIEKGLKRATGDICAWLNSSDLYLSGALGFVNAYFQAHPGVDLAFGDALLVSEDGRVVGEKRLVDVDWESLLLQHRTLAQPSVFWRRGLFEKAGGFDRSLKCLLDAELFIRMLRAGRARHVGRFLASSRLHEDAITARLTQRMIEEWNCIDQVHRGRDEATSVNRRILGTLNVILQWLARGHPGYALRIACDSILFGRALDRASRSRALFLGVGVLRAAARVLKIMTTLGGAGRIYQTC